MDPPGSTPPRGAVAVTTRQLGGGTERGCVSEEVVDVLAGDGGKPDRPLTDSPSCTRGGPGDAEAVHDA